ncbi:DCD domain-containing protein NRP-B-like [Primulina eburnea]|uniref:DCD domain-containing protein NRP-B-like n=1 Tax=Primulina eburnea TaxID=1245227 RepID=UPI003C6C3093
MESNQSSFWQFSDNLRLQTDNLSLNDSIWSGNYGAKRPAVERRNFDFRNGGDVGSVSSPLELVNDIESDLERLNLGFINEGWKAPAPVKDNVPGFGAPRNNFGFTNDDWKSTTNADLPRFGFNDSISGYGFSNDVWKGPLNDDVSGFGSKPGLHGGLNGGFSKGIYLTTPSLNIKSYYGKGKGHFMNNVVVNGKVNKGGGKNEEEMAYGGAGKIGKKNKGNKENNGNGENKNGVDKRFKTLPPAEALSRNETIGGYIFVCNNDTMAENLKRQLFGLPPRYRDSVRAITPGLPLFLYNYSTHQLHGIFEAATFGGSNIDPTAWEDKKNPGESRFPAQVRVITRKICEPLEEDSFRPILHHYDGPKFRLELTVPEALSLLDIFAESNA